MKRSRSGSTIKQVAYATRVMSGNASSKKEAALLSGYSMSMAENAKHAIEETEGYQNALIGLATQSQNLLLAAMAEYKARGLKNFTNKDLNSALNAISNAFSHIEKHRAPNALSTPGGNPLRAVLERRVEKITLEPATQNTASASSPIPEGAIKVTDVEVRTPLKEDDLDL